MAGELTLRVITPDRIAVDETAESVQIPAVDGRMGILPKHAPMVAALDVGELTYRSGGREVSLFVSGGFAEVRDDTVRLVTQAGELASEIDEARAREAEGRARKNLEEARRPDSDIDFLRAQAALRRAMLRLRVRGRS
ncbi:MAG: F0F1 ATP synthase subunit epsilon [Planctomycetota bacterium]